MVLCGKETSEYVCDTLRKGLQRAIGIYALQALITCPKLLDKDFCKEVLTSQVGA